MPALPLLACLASLPALPCLQAGSIAATAEFFSFGTNDLTQMTFGYSRDDIGKFLPVYLEKGILQYDPFQVGGLWLVPCALPAVCLWLGAEAGVSHPWHLWGVIGALAQQQGVRASPSTRIRYHSTWRLRPIAWQLPGTLALLRSAS